jgi:hypothetical protein
MSKSKDLVGVPTNHAKTSSTVSVSESSGLTIFLFSDGPPSVTSIVDSAALDCDASQAMNALSGRGRLTVNPGGALCRPRLTNLYGVGGEDEVWKNFTLNPRESKACLNSSAGRFAKPSAVFDSCAAALDSVNSAKSLDAPPAPGRAGQTRGKIVGNEIRMARSKGGAVPAFFPTFEFEDGRGQKHCVTSVGHRLPCVWAVVGSLMTPVCEVLGIRGRWRLLHFEPHESMSDFGRVDRRFTRECRGRLFLPRRSGGSCVQRSDTSILCD